MSLFKNLGKTVKKKKKDFDIGVSPRLVVKSQH